MNAPSRDLLDTNIADLLRASNMLTFPPARERTPADIRATLAEYIDTVWAEVPLEPVAGIENGLIDRSADGGPELPVRLYTPANPRAIIMYFHGGGYVAGSIDTHDRMARRLANGAAAQVISVGYRLAPEHPYPAGPDDCLAATLWAAEKHPDTPLVVAGDSAGGTMVISVTLRARDMGRPFIAGQVLIYPALDPSTSTPSMERFATGYGLTRADMQHYHRLFLPDREARPDDPYADAFRRVDLRDLPPAVVTTAGFDPLRDEGAGYAARLVRAGVPVTYLPEPGMIHGYLELAAVIEGANAARERLIRQVAQLF